MSKNTVFLPLSVAVITVSNRHTAESDTTGQMLVNQIKQQQHLFYRQQIVAEDRYQLRAAVSDLIADPYCQVIILSGGTGFQAKNCTRDALKVLFDRTIDGFAELFRQLSFSGTVKHQAVLSAAMQSDAVAGLANDTIIFAIPGSPDAADLAASQLIWPQLDARTKPCNFANLLNNRQCPAISTPINHNSNQELKL